MFGNFLTYFSDWRLWVKDWVQRPYLSRRMATSPLLVTNLYLPQAIVVRLHVRKINVVILTHSWCLSSSISWSKGFLIQDEAMGVVRSASQGAHYHASLTGNNEGNNGLVVPQVKPTQPQFSTNSLFTPVGYKPLHFIPTVCHSVQITTVVDNYQPCCLPPEVELESKSPSFSIRRNLWVTDLDTRRRIPFRQNF